MRAGDCQKYRLTVDRFQRSRVFPPGRQNAGNIFPFRPSRTLILIEPLASVSITRAGDFPSVTPTAFHDRKARYRASRIAVGFLLRNLPPDTDAQQVIDELPIDNCSCGNSPACMLVQRSQKLDVRMTHRHSGRAQYFYNGNIVSIFRAHPTCRGCGGGWLVTRLVNSWGLDPRTTLLPDANVKNSDALGDLKSRERHGLRSSDVTKLPS